MKDKNDLSKMWCDEAHNYVLLNPDGSQSDPPWPSCAIFYLPTGTLVLLEEDDVALYVKQHMFAAGVPIVSAEELRPLLETYND